MNCLVASIPFNPQAEARRIREPVAPGAAGVRMSCYTAYEFARLRSLLRRSGHEVITADLGDSARSQVAALLRGCQPDVVIVDSSSFQDHTERHLLSQFFLLVKSISPGVRTIWGGRDASVLADFALTHSLVTDVVLCEESDSVLPRLLTEWEERGYTAMLDSVPGIAFRRDGEVVRTRPLDPSELIELDSLPFLDYERIEVLENEWPLIVSSRGCPYSCRFCYRQYRVRRCHSVAYFVDHLAYLCERYGFRQFRFDDELFTLDRERCAAICDEIVARNLRIEFDCYSRVNTFDAGLGARLKCAGCRMVWFGIESGSDEVLKSMHKVQNTTAIAGAVDAAKRAGLAVCCNVLVGYPGETMNSMLQTMLLLARLQPERLSVQRLKVMPGTELFDWCKARGALDDQAWMLEDRDLCWEGDFSRDVLDSVVGRLRALDCGSAQPLDEHVAKYLIFKGGRPVCLCKGVTEQELAAAVRSGAASVEAIRLCTGATGGCGGCARIVSTMLEVWNSQSQAK
jgi:radical SAM superfamily enzyme YgiQ (UPF0313 family)/bacterioferritin-associated ferredoxin